MAHGEAVRPLESTDGKTVDITSGAANVKAKTVEELLVIVIERLDTLIAIEEMRERV